jgi:hypothetical protein
VSDARLAAASFFAVATSPVMPDWSAYREQVERARPPAREVESPGRLRELLGGPVVPSSSASRIVATLVSFTDDHRERVPEELFPSATEAFVEGIARAREEGRVLSRGDQLALARSLVSTPFDAMVICHAGTRQLARGRDVRALRRALPLSFRCEAGQAIAAFPEALSAGGDPLGDTYHYWANVIAGVTAGYLGGVRGAIIERLFLPECSLGNARSETGASPVRAEGVPQRADPIACRSARWGMPEAKRALRP